MESLSAGQGGLRAIASHPVPRRRGGGRPGRIICAAAALALLAACDAPRTTPASTPPAPKLLARYDAAPAGVGHGAQCQAAERVIYSCRLKQHRVSVCASARAIAYRYGSDSKTALEIVSDGADGRAHLGTVRGPGRGGAQTGLRFSNGGYDYIVYSAVGGTETVAPGRQWSGLVVMKGGEEVSSSTCPESGPPQRFDLDSVPTFVADEDKLEFLAFF